MRMEGREESENVEDRRGMRIPGGGRGAGVGCLGLLAVLVISWLTGADPNKILGLIGLVQQMSPPAVEQRVPAGQSRPDDPQAHFVAKVLRATEDAWGQVFAREGRTYQKPTLVLFDGRVDSACGMTSAAVGPFYCPADRKVYLDLAFFRELAQRFGAPGDFAQAYVVAHEVGHHVQNLLGLSDRVTALQQRAGSQEQANALSVRLELQADCFAGVYGHFDQQYLEPGDVEGGLRAAAAIGDDMIQKQAQGYTTPESWTHGSSQMRARWLKQGLESGNPASCDTFKAPQP
ncbi:MAG TPA: neutral zinc metallopeptidase [Vicinamibacteria bacterium]|nr:neutral zinc metallopeptidase [Vicinamibacteria bacterium]